jgi:hypothetical protein
MVIAQQLLRLRPVLLPHPVQLRRPECAFTKPYLVFCPASQRLQLFWCCGATNSTRRRAWDAHTHQSDSDIFNDVSLQAIELRDGDDLPA